MYPILKLGNLEIKMYLTMIILGITISFIIGYFLICKKEKMTLGTLLRFFLVLLIGASVFYIGAALFDSLFHSIEDKRVGIYGITWLGGVVVGFPITILMIHLLLPEYKGRALYLFSLMIPLIALGHSIGRIGCFLEGCCYGKVTESWIGVSFPPGSIASYEYPGLNGYSQKVIPTMLIESVFEFILFIVMMAFRKKIIGHELEIYLILYSVFRFIIEFYRGDDRGITIIGLSPSQLLSLICLISGVLIILFHKKIIFKKEVKE